VSSALTDLAVVLALVEDAGLSGRSAWDALGSHAPSAKHAEVKSATILRSISKLLVLNASQSFRPPSREQPRAALTV
jgi:hypothetical protein